MGSSISVQVTGFVGSEPQVKEVGEQRVVSFSLAVNRKTSSGKQQTLWVRVNTWNGLGDVAVKFLRKGSLAQVELRGFVLAHGLTRTAKRVSALTWMPTVSFCWIV